VHFHCFLSTVERPVAAEGFPPLCDSVLRGKLLLGKEKSASRWQKHFSSGQAKYSGGVMHLCRGCEAADYLHKVLKE